MVDEWALPACFSKLYIRWTPGAIVAIKDHKDYIRVLLYSSYIIIMGWEVLLSHTYWKEHFGSGVGVF